MKKVETFSNKNQTASKQFLKNFSVYSLHRTSKILLPLIPLSNEKTMFKHKKLTFVQAARSNLPIKEGAIPSVYKNQNSTSHFKSFLDSVWIYKEMIRFSLSSLFCSVIDIGLFTLIFNLLSANAISWSSFGATSLARLVSAAANYFINKKIVFENRDSTSTQAAKYFMLCAVQMVFSWLILQGLTSLSNEHVVLLKIITDVLLFLINFLVQRIFIFERHIYYEKIAQIS
jgi:putative flippase GtrA